MGKPTKNKKQKVRKITEEEYAKYISALQSAEKKTEKPSPPLKTNAQ